MDISKTKHITKQISPYIFSPLSHDFENTKATKKYPKQSPV